MLKETLIKVNKKWHQESLKLANPLLGQTLVKRFADNEICLSQDVVEVYSTIGGFEDNDMDSECLTF